MKRNALPTLSTLALVGILAGCPAGEEVTIGVVLNETTITPEVAQSVRRGIELGLEAVQADPDQPYTIALDIRDANGDAGTVAEELYDAGAIGVVGGISTEDALAIADVANREGRVFITPTALSDELSGISRTFFRIALTNRQEASAMANFATETLDVDELVILAAEDRAFTDSLLEDLRTVFGQYGGNVKEIIHFGSEDDLATVAEQAVALEPTGVYIAAYSPQIAGLVKALRDQGYGLTEGKKEWIMTTSVFTHPAILEQAGPSVNGVYLTMSAFDTSAETPPMSDFVAAYRERHGTDPDVWAGHGYDSILLVGAALKASTNTLPQEFLKGMRAMDPLTGVTGNIQFDEEGNVQKFARIHMIRDGKLVDYRVWYESRMEEIKRRMEQLKRETTRLHTETGDS
ncbi:MAG: ABC transporter substrate-binding protein [Thermoanaerobaculia bacterium]|nr:ABC transporter substrate-binding protein [Thermoanaerobaculia bacterium]